MGKQLCIIHANCQGEALAPFLEASEDFSAKFEIRHYLNYKKPELAAADIQQCGLFLYQYLGPKWGNYSSDELLRQLPKSAQTLAIPNFFFKGYWPFWTDKLREIEFADSLLEELLGKGLPASAVLNLYLRGSDALFGDLEKIAADSIKREREKEKATPIRYVDLLEGEWRSRQLFLTVNHPGVRLLAHAATQILALLELQPFPEKALKTYIHPQDEFWLPIHPAVGRRLRFPFAAPSRLYPCFGLNLTHAEYTSRYLACREHGISDLTGVLKGLAEDQLRAKPLNEQS